MNSSGILRRVAIWLIVIAVLLMIERFLRR
jgi:hypothetical protein